MRKPSLNVLCWLGWLAFGLVPSLILLAVMLAGNGEAR